MSDNSNVSISKTILQYKDLQTLQEFAQAQNTTILQLSKKIQKYEDQIKHLEQLLKTSVPIIKTSPEGVDKFAEDDSEYICQIEIAKLKQFTLERELTIEENRKFDTYFKILTMINSKNKNQEKEAQKLPTEDLLKLVESKDVNGTRK